MRRLPAHARDRPWLDELRRVAYRDLFDATFGGWDEARHQRHFEATWAFGGIVIIEVDGVRVGMLQTSERDDEIEIREIQIHPSHANKGIGTHLIEEVLAAAAQSDRDVVLSTGLHNAGAIRLYARLGFTEETVTDTKVFMRWRRAQWQGRR